MRRVLSVSCITVLAACGLAWGGSVQAGEFKRFPEYAYESRQQTDVEALKELLKQAQELQKAQDAQDAAEAKDAAEEAVVAEKKATADAAVEKRGGSSQAGCMYRDNKLIWEKKPGTCKP